MRSVGIACLAFLLGVCGTADADVLRLKEGGRQVVKILSVSDKEVTYRYGKDVVGKVSLNEVLFYCGFGGAPVTERFAKEIGADGFAPEAASATDVAKELVAA